MYKYLTKIFCAIFAINILFVACVDNPANQTINFVQGKKGALVLCEALMGSDNSSVTCINFETNDFTTNYFGNNNAGQKLGSLANDLVILGDTVYVTVSGSRTIEAFLLSTGKSIGRIIFPEYVMPRKMAFMSDTLAFVTTYVAQSTNESDNCVYEFNPQKIELTGVKIQVGSHPEGIAYYNNKLYVANSGFGDFQYPPNASTISIIDLTEKKEVQNVQTGNNPARVYAANGKIYLVYWELPSLQEAGNNFGGIIEYDAATMNVLREWKTPIYDLCFNSEKDTIFYLNSSVYTNISNELAPGVNCIALKNTNAKSAQLIKNPDKNQIWSTLAVNDFTKELWVANSFDFQSNGEIIVYDFSNFETIKKSYKTGVIPNAIRFY